MSVPVLSVDGQYLPGGAMVDTSGSGGGWFSNTLQNLANSIFSGGTNPISGIQQPYAPPAGGTSMAMAPYAGLPGGIAVGSPYYNTASGQTRLASRFSPDGIHVYINRGTPLLFRGDIAAVKRVRRVGRLCHRFFPSRYRGHARRRYR
jgi:hypothetical protein